jgi:hypothetical protein
LRPVSRVPRDSEQRLLAPPTVGTHPEIAKQNAAIMAFRVFVVVLALAVFAYFVYDYAVGPRDENNSSVEEGDDP